MFMFDSGNLHKNILIEWSFCGGAILGVLDISSSRSNNTKEWILVDGLYSYNGRAKLYFTEANSIQHIEIIT